MIQSAADRAMHLRHTAQRVGVLYACLLYKIQQGASRAKGAHVGGDQPLPGMGTHGLHPVFKGVKWPNSASIVREAMISASCAACSVS